MIAVFPGTFDPITVGHVDLIQRILPMFDKVIIAIGVNSKKQTLFPLANRIEWIQKVFEAEKKIETGYYEGLTVKFCLEKNASYIIRGLRSASDFEYERDIAQLNRSISDKVDTMFVISAPERTHISSTIVREIIHHQGDLEKYIPKSVILDVKKSYSEIK